MILVWHRSSFVRDDVVSTTNAAACLIRSGDGAKPSTGATRALAGSYSGSRLTCLASLASKAAPRATHIGSVAGSSDRRVLDAAFGESVIPAATLANLKTATEASATPPTSFCCVRQEVSATRTSPIKASVPALVRRMRVPRSRAHARRDRGRSGPCEDHSHRKGWRPPRPGPIHIPGR